MIFQLNIKYFLCFVLAIQLLSSCEDRIDIDTDPLTEQLVVDAWLTNESEPQTIILTMSQPYFEETLPAGLSGATVQVIDENGQTFDFIETTPGNYVWTPAAGENIGEIGTDYGLVIEVNDQTYVSASTMNRVPPVDSITYEFRDDELFGPDGIYTEFYARDFVGSGDTYWIKTFKNDTLLNKPDEINITFDAGFSEGAAIDGLIFIPPIREATNRVSDPDTADDSDVPPWEIGDNIRVEIHSLTNETFLFMGTAVRQMLNGQSGIFAEPVINTVGNIVSTTNEDEIVLGIFNVAAVSKLSVNIE